MKINKLIATFFGSGLTKKAPGTSGTFAAFLLSLIFVCSDNFATICAIITILTLIIGTIATEIYIKDKQNKDPKEVVIDEVCGYFTACALTFSYIGTVTIPFLILIFIIFRILDIIKPFPISIIDKKMKNSVGVMFDDFLAGILTALLVCGLFDLIYF